MEAILFDPSNHSPDLLSSMAQLHMDCILHDHMLATFLPPLDHSRVLKMWQDNAADTTTGTREIIMVLNPDDAHEVIGVVQLHMSNTETGPFRGEVLKLFASPHHRRKGIARKLMAKLEEVGLQRGTTLLMLDTLTGSPAEQVYPRFGYTELGKIPDFGYSPKDRSLTTETFYYKDLRKVPPLKA